jgi:hypothetical protein
MHDLLDKEWKRGHLYRHNLESLFYVIVILCYRYDLRASKVQCICPYDSWFTGTYGQIYAQKYMLLSPRARLQPFGQCHFQNFHHTLKDLHDMFCDVTNLSYDTTSGLERKPKKIARIHGYHLIGMHCRTMSREVQGHPSEVELEQ